MSIIDNFLEKFSDAELPNPFSMGMGKLIRVAREESGFSQRELAQKIYRRQAALSDMENGKMEPNASTLLYLAFHLKRPISYFFPTPYKPKFELDELSELEKEIVSNSRELKEDDQIRIIAQLRALSALQKKQ